MHIVLLDALTFGDDADLSAFDRFGTVTVYGSTAYDETAERINDADVVVTNKVVIDHSLMQQAKHLKLICVAATGMNNIDLQAAQQLGIAVRNVAGYSTHSVVQHTFSILLYLVGHSSYYDRYVKDGLWEQSPVFTHIGPPFFELYGKKWGIIGMGAIGQGVAQVANAFGAEVLYYSTSGKNSNQPYRQVTLENLLRECDIVTIHAPLNADTQNLIYAGNLDLLKDRAVLINVGRGGIINEADLAAIWDTKELSVGLDVVTQEPIEAHNPLHEIKSQRLYITPHIAWTSIEARQRLIASIAEHIKVYSEGGS